MKITSSIDRPKFVPFSVTVTFERQQEAEKFETELSDTLNCCSCFEGFEKLRDAIVKGL